MAKTSSIHRNLKKIKKVLKALKKRAKWREILKSGDHDEQAAVSKKLQQTRNESAVRVRNRCRQCGRPCGTYRKFALCRIHLREAMMRGEVPGLRKASW